MKNLSEIKLFGTHLRKLREEKGLSQQHLADLADLAKITIQRIENAKYSVTLDVMISIAKALGISLKPDYAVEDYEIFELPALAGLTPI